MQERSGGQQSLDEAWCSLMDGQASEFDLQRLLRSAEEADLMRWHRYQLVRSVIGNELPDGGVVDLRAGVAAALDESGAEQPVAAGPAGRIWRALGSVAIAASVAAVVVVGGLGLRDGGLPGLQQGAGVELASGADPAVAERGQPVLASSAQPDIIRLAPSEAGVPVRQLPDLQRHADMAVLVGSGGMSPYARVSTLKPVLVREQR